VGQEGRKVGSLKQWARSHVVRGEMQNCTPLWREAHFQVKMPQTPDLSFGPLFEVGMSKNGTPLWRDLQLKPYKIQNTAGPDH